ncbi:MAG: 50S ribosomal protein L23 [Armatimonadota bacterium]
MPDLYEVIQRPVITEKALSMNGERKYAFIVHPDANKVQIRSAVENLFTTPEGGKLNVTSVNTIRVKGHTKRYRMFGRMSVGKTPTVKKAIVTVAEGQSIQIFEGV